MPYWTNGSLASDFFDDMDRIFDGFKRGDQALAIHDEKSFQPVCEIAESDAHCLMSFDLPGVKKEDIKIEAIDNVLTISGERKRETARAEVESNRTTHIRDS